MSHLLQLVIELVWITFLLVYRDGAINSFNDSFNPLISFKDWINTPSLKMVFKLGYVYSKGICFFNRLLRSGSLGLYFIMSLTLLHTWLFLLVDFSLACSLDKDETCSKWLLTIDGL